MISRILTFIFTLTLCLSIFSGTFRAIAQPTQPSSVEKQPSSPPETPSSKPPEANPGLQRPKISLPGTATAAPSPMAAQDNKRVQKAYLPPNYENVARALWALNLFPINDDQAVDNFLKITECDLYSRYFLNEFEWRQIRNHTRSYIEKYKKDFSLHFEYVQPLLLERYDFALKGFPIKEDSAFKSSTRMEFGVGLNKRTRCYDGNMGRVDGYPNSAMLSINQPFKLSFVRMSEPLAQEYIKMIDESGVDKREGRPAYIRFRIHVDRIIGLQREDENVYVNFGGAIDSIEIFADREMMFKLYEQNFFN